MHSASASWAWGSRTNASPPEPSWARSPSMRATASPTSDLTFGVADHVEVADVLDDWTRTLVDEFDAVPLVDLERGPITYRVFLLPDALQLDLSMSPAAQFRPAGPRFRLVFGETAADGPESLRASGRRRPLHRYAVGP